MGTSDVQLRTSVFALILADTILGLLLLAEQSSCFRFRKSFQLVLQTQALFLTIIILFLYYKIALCTERSIIGCIPQIIHHQTKRQVNSSILVATLQASL